MTAGIEQVLFRDPQAERPAGRCPRCGGEIYAPGGWCIVCRKKAEDDADGTEQVL